jgi:hypothetical protein
LQRSDSFTEVAAELHANFLAQCLALFERGVVDMGIRTPPRKGLVESFSYLGFARVDRSNAALIPFE